MTSKTIKQGLLTLAVLITLAGCKYGEDFKTFQFKTPEGEWAIDYPPYMRTTRKIYPGAEFQATNGYRDTYAFTTRLRTTKSAAAMSDSLNAVMMDNLDDPRVEFESTYVIDGTTFHTMRLTGMMKGRRMFYLISVIDDGERLFHFTAWMFNKKRELWEDDLNQMLHSWQPGSGSL